MVRGLDRFREHFREFTDRYVLIGGTACDLIMSDAGLEFRATKDLDIVLCLEKLDSGFGRTFWEFIEAGGYRIRETAERKPRFYRFEKPGVADSPFMLELFSPAPETLSLPEGSVLTPIPFDSRVSSLSAILLDPIYYGWILSGRREIDGVSLVGPEHLVPLKASAWLDPSARKAAGEDIDKRSVRKHRNDILRLFTVVDPKAAIDPPVPVTDVMASCLERLLEEDLDPKSLGLKTTTLKEVVAGLADLYGVAPEILFR